MAKNMLLPAAAASEDSRKRPLREILLIAVPLGSLMMSGIDGDLFSCFLAMMAAFLLAIMTEEDAHEQTIDLRALLLLAVVFFCLACMQGRHYNFLMESVVGMFIFQSFRILLSIWMTWRAGDDISKSEKQTVKAESPAIGYVPIFFLVFVMYLGFGTAWASPVFDASSEFISIIKELAAVFPQTIALCFMGFIFFMVFLDTWVAVYSYHHKTFIWAFGGGDVIFLGLFVGYLGFGPLLAIYFLSLITQFLLFNVPNILKRGRDAS